MLVPLWKAWWSDSRGKVIGVLLVLWIAALVHEYQLSSVLSVLLAVGTMITSDLIIAYWLSKKFTFSLSSVVTGLLIGLIADPSGPVASIFIASLASSLSKQFIRIKDLKHVFNPAAFGITVSSLLFNRPVAWWGASWGLVPVSLIALGMLPIIWKLRRLTMPITFLVVYFLINLFQSNIESALRLTLDGTVFLLAFVMLPEPVTAPLRGFWKYGWGILVGSLVAAENILHVSVGDPLLLALLGANVIGYLAVKVRPRFIPLSGIV